MQCSAGFELNPLLNCQPLMCFTSSAPRWSIKPPRSRFLASGGSTLGPGGIGPPNLVQPPKFLIGSKTVISLSCYRHRNHPAYFCGTRSGCMAGQGIVTEAARLKSRQGVLLSAETSQTNPSTRWSRGDDTTCTGTRYV